MKKLVDAEVAIQTMKLRQLGAKIRVINSKMCYVVFDLGSFKVKYAYNVNKDGNYFLERIAPYPLPLREFENEEGVVNIIEIDIEQFQNALKSHNINSFIDINQKLNKTIRKFEDLFLYYNVSEEKTSKIYNMLKEINEEIDSAKADSKRLYFKKEPENL
ncbi:MAG: ROK family protein [Clostridiales bacterium]|nr:ROK family protein [Clostridiales bacterium]